MDSFSAAALTAAALILSFLNGIIGMRLPDHCFWISALEAEPITKILLSSAKNPRLATDTVLENVHYIYCQPSRNGQLFEENGILFTRDLFKNDNKLSWICL